MRIKLFVSSGLWKHGKYSHCTNNVFMGFVFLLRFQEMQCRIVELCAHNCDTDLPTKNCE